MSPARLPLCVFAVFINVLGCRQGDVGIVVGGKAAADSGGASDGADGDGDGDGDDPGAADEDGDGHDSEADCDDSNPEVFPGAPEVADDGVDQDCDGVDSLTEYGFRDDEGSTALVEGFIIGNRVTLDAPLRVTELGMIGRSETTGEVRMAVYSTDVGRPDELVAATAGHVPALGANLLPVEAPVELGAGEWWVMIISGATVEIGAGPDALVAYRELDYTAPLPDPFGLASEYDGPRISVFVAGELP